jgi:hypothetical protein
MSSFWEPNMKKLTLLGVAVFTALLAVLAVSGSLSPAQAYPERIFKLEVTRSVLYGGQSFTATAFGNVTCDWTLDWNNETRTAQRDPNKEFNTTYVAPRVSHVTKIPLVGTCAYDAEENPSARATVTPASWSRTIIITVLPRGAAVSPPGGTDLPSTGGPDWRVLAGGLLLLFSGATAVTVARRRAEEAEVQATQA